VQVGVCKRRRLSVVSCKHSELLWIEPERNLPRAVTEVDDLSLKAWFHHRNFLPFDFNQYSRAKAQRRKENL
jgi:hypothetical protein